MKPHNLLSTILLLFPPSPIQSFTIAKKPHPHRTKTALFDTKKQYSHSLAILTLPVTTPDRIANEAILNEGILHTKPDGKLSVILRCRDDDNPAGHSLPNLRRYMSELYSTAWDAMSMNSSPLNIVVYPGQLPNTPPESWLYLRKDLKCIVSHDCILGWHSTGSGSHVDKEGEGEGGLSSHVAAINRDRESRGLKPVDAVEVSPWPVGAVLPPIQDVFFLEDEFKKSSNEDVFLEDEKVFMEDKSSIEVDTVGCNLWGSRVKIQDELLCYNVCVGGTFDGLHYGHRKILTLAVSSVDPYSGKLFIGVTSDEMLQKKTLKDYIPPVEERIRKVEEFLNDLAPGLKNRYKIMVINDPFGPPAYEDDFDALILSHETLENGLKMNELRKKNGLKPMRLLCTRRTEENFMSSTMLRRWRSSETAKAKQ